jgi:hypothetical protein
MAMAVGQAAHYAKFFGNWNGAITESPRKQGRRGLRDAPRELLLLIELWIFQVPM